MDLIADKISHRLNKKLSYLRAYVLKAASEKFEGICFRFGGGFLGFILFYFFF